MLILGYFKCSTEKCKTLFILFFLRILDFFPSLHIKDNKNSNLISFWHAYFCNLEIYMKTKYDNSNLRTDFPLNNLKIMCMSSSETSLKLNLLYSLHMTVWYEDNDKIVLTSFSCFSSFRSSSSILSAAPSTAKIPWRKGSIINNWKYSQSISNKTMWWWTKPYKSKH